VVLEDLQDRKEVMAVSRMFIKGIDEQTKIERVLGDEEL